MERDEILSDLNSRNKRVYYMTYDEGKLYFVLTNKVRSKWGDNGAFHFGSDREEVLNVFSGMFGEGCADCVMDKKLYECDEELPLNILEQICRGDNCYRFHQA